MHTPHREEVTPAGICIGVCLVLAALVLGGLYLWGALLSEEVKPEQQIDSVDVRAHNDTTDSTRTP